MTTRPNLDRIKKQVKDLVAQMTLDEKLAQLGAYYVYDLQTKGEHQRS